MKLGLFLIKNSNETYSFVGSVPVQLSYVTKSGNTTTDEEVISQLRLPSNLSTIKQRTFSCIEDALREANRLNFIINNIDEK